jgi:hypothetical protein
LPALYRGCFKSPLSSRERVGVRGVKISKLLFIYPHPNLLPEGEGIVFDFYDILIQRVGVAFDKLLTDPLTIK